MRNDLEKDSFTIKYYFELILTAKRFLPLALLALMTPLPLAEAMRFKKPCTLNRLILFGCQVRFDIKCPLKNAAKL